LIREDRGLRASVFRRVLGVLIPRQTVEGWDSALNRVGRSGDSSIHPKTEEDQHMVVRDKTTDEYLGIRCDVTGCRIMSPPAEQILKGHGLNNMGWECHGGTHLCPVHAGAAR